MIPFLKFTIAASAVAFLASCGSPQQTEQNKTNNQQETNVSNLEKEAIENARKIIGQLTIKEKLAQLQSGSLLVIKAASDEDGNLNFDTLKKYYPYGMGMMNVDFADAPQEKYTRQVNSLKEYHKTLAHPIPCIYIGEGLHGLMSNGTTVFPQAIALGCSWDTVQLGKVYRTTALEANARGINLLFSPILDLARDPRFGRIEEMYSEDPYLCGSLGSTAVRNFQQQKPDGSLFVASTLKHYVGHGQVEGGRNVAAFTGSANDLLNNHLLPFEMAVKAGAAAVMPAYNDVCDLPVTVNKWLLQDVLRKSLNFNGLIVSDQNAVDVMYTVNTVASSLQEAAEMAITAGINIDIIWAKGTFDLLENSVKEGKISEHTIDKALEYLLVLKYKLGLFANDAPADIDNMNKITNCQAHKDLARETARKTMVLLKNDTVKNLPILPLDSSKVKHIAVIGPNANSLDYGGYTAEPVVPGVSVYQGFKNFCDQKGIKVSYAEGCKIATTPGAFWQNDNQVPNDPKDDEKLINQAVSVARSADVIVLCIGENVSFSREAWGEDHRGDRDDINLLGRQTDLIKKLAALGKPIVTFVFGGRPLNIKPAADNSNALVQCFYLGQEGGNAVADVVFGKYNFEGKLSVSIPHSAGSLPCYYNMKPSRYRSYIYEEEHCLYPFGYGLSYSKFEISEPKSSRAKYMAIDTVEISVDVKNIGNKEGSETVQLYIHDDFSSSVRPIKELRGFEKVYLKPNEQKTVTFKLSKNDFMYYGQSLKKIFEPGSFTIMVGNSSDNVKKCSIEIN